MWNIAGQVLGAGEKKKIILEPNAADYGIPSTLICGVKPGKTLLVTAGIHSGEYPGIPAAARLANEVDPLKLTGNIIIMHCVNTSGFWERIPNVVPEDGTNLNADYPGREDGGAGQRIADYFVKEIFPNIDFLVDLHSGSTMEELTPCLFFPKAEKVRKRALEAAKALNIPYLIESSNKSGECGYAANYFDVPGLLLERGYNSICRQEWIEAYYRDLRLLLSYLEMYGLDKPMEICTKNVYTDTVYLESEIKGLWFPAVKADQHVASGQYLGRIEDFYGNVLKKYYAEAEGTVFYYTCALSVTPGKALVAYGLEKGKIRA
ncbi:MAG: M14 family metallopeptidase [Eubacteriales bacterium]|nr:M14 family metallopeptidase [Eubacteriales bacterium]